MKEIINQPAPSQTAGNSVPKTEVLLDRVLYSEEKTPRGRLYDDPLCLACEDAGCYDCEG